MKVTIGQGTWAEGHLKGELIAIASQHGGDFPHLVIEMSVSGVTEPVRVILNTLDLFTIVRLAAGSAVQQIRDAVRLESLSSLSEQPKTR